jgi:hypothetical protein
MYPPCKYELFKKGFNTIVALLLNGEQKNIFVKKVVTKEGSLFVTLKCPKSKFPHHAFGTIWKLSLNRGASRWFGNVLTYGAKVIKY